MIVAKIYKHTNGKITGFSIEGHSGTAPRGSDIVCAGISTVSQAAYICIVEHLKRDFHGNFGEGKLSIRIDEPDELTEAVFQTMLIGVREIKKRFPNAVKLTIKNV